MKRIIVRFIADDTGDWKAELSCGHDQHVHHRPPFLDRPWVLDDAARLERVGTTLLCPLCDRAELPTRVRMTNNSSTWDEVTIPDSLLHSHRLPEGKWGVIRVDTGRLNYATAGEIIMNVTVAPDSPQAIPPGLDHMVELSGPVRFSVEFFSVEDEDAPRTAGELASLPGRAIFEETQAVGGDSACWANLVCPDCGRMIDDHHPTHGSELKPE